VNSDNLDGNVVMLLSSFSPDVVLADRVSACHGIRMNRGNGRSAYPIITPKDSWRPLTTDELRSVCGTWNNSLGRGTYIGVFEVSATALSRCVEYLDWYFSETKKSLEECKARVADLSLFQEVYSLRGDEGDSFLGVASAQPDMRVVTIDRDVDCLVGLHFDNFDKLPLKERSRGRNRICINVGSESRFFMFVRSQAHALLETVISKSDADPDLRTRLITDHRELVFRYFTMFPETVVYRVELKPGEGYMAPTENIIHEGSTLGTHAVDWTMVWFGRFRWCNLKLTSQIG